MATVTSTLAGPVGASRYTIPITAVIASQSTGTNTVLSLPVACLGATSLRVYTNLTAQGGGNHQITVTVQGHDPTNDTWYTLLAGAALAATGVVRLIVDPRIAASANLIAQVPLPERIRVSVVEDGDPTTTWSVAVELTN
jgi:hypothetical protein